MAYFRGRRDFPGIFCCNAINCLKSSSRSIYFEACCGAASNPSQATTSETSMLTAEQVLSAQKANLETLFGLTGKAFEGVEKLVELNLQVTKTAIGEAAENAKAA